MKKAKRPVAKPSKKKETIPAIKLGGLWFSQKEARRVKKEAKTIKDGAKAPNTEDKKTAVKNISKKPAPPAKKPAPPAKKTTPVQAKKKTPVQKKKATPIQKKKATPVQKKKATQPEKKTAPVQTKKEKPVQTKKATQPEKKTAPDPEAPEVAEVPAPAPAVPETPAPAAEATPAPAETNVKAFDPMDYPDLDDQPEWQQAEEDHEPFSEAELALFRDNLRVLRAKLSGKAASLQSQSLHRYDEVNNAEDGTDAMTRNTELKKASLDEDQIKQIDMALLALENGTYGICQNCGGKIGTKRLLAIPFAKFCIQCQAEMEEQEARRGPSSDSETSGYDD